MQFGQKQLQAVVDKSNELMKTQVAHYIDLRIKEILKLELKEECFKIKEEEVKTI